MSTQNPKPQAEPAEACGERHPYDRPGVPCTRVKGHEQPTVWRVPFKIEGHVLIEAPRSDRAEDIVWSQYFGEEDIADSDLDGLLDRAENGLRVDVSGPVYPWTAQ